MKHVIFVIVLAVLKDSHLLNPEILKYDLYMKNFEATGRQLKRGKNEETNALIVKREDQSSFWPFSIDTEDMYIEQVYGNSTLAEDRTWVKIHEWFANNRTDDLKKYCAEVHKRAGFGTIAVKDVIFKKRTLSFTNAKYEPRLVDVLSYSRDHFPENPNFKYYVYPHTEEFLHLTEGWQPGCVYYLSLLAQNTTESNTEEFRIDKPVCGVPE